MAFGEAAIEEAVDGLHEGDLDGVGVLEQRQFKAAPGGPEVGFGVVAAPLVVEKAETFLAQGGRVYVATDAGDALKWADANRRL